MHRWLLPHAVAPVYERLSGRRPWTTLAHLRELQWRAPGELEARAVESLRRLLAHAEAQVPYYRDLFRRAGVRPTDIRSVEDLAAVPVTTKADLRAALPDGALAANVPASRRLVARTSGSTGQPFEFYLDRADVDIRRGSYLFFREWAGAPPWYTRVMVAIPSFVPPHYRPSPWLTWGRRILLGERVEHLHTDHLTLPRVRAHFRRLARGRPYFLYGPPSYLAHLSSLLLDAGSAMPRAPAVVIACGETLTDFDRSAIERAFRCPVVSHYSTLEVLYLGQTCPEEPSVFHTNAERAVVRVVGPDGRAAAPGEPGRVVVTDLANSVMPFINYDLGDLALTAPPCRCGRGLPTLARLEGRVGELIRTRDRVVSAATLGYYLTDICHAAPHLREFQALVEGAHSVVLRVVPTAQFGPATAAIIRTRLEELLGPGMTVRVEPVGGIALEPSGKRLIIKVLPSGGAAERSATPVAPDASRRVVS
jgi:phenylacetate-CoA ligase